MVSTGRVVIVSEIKGAERGRLDMMIMRNNRLDMMIMRNNRLDMMIMRNNRLDMMIMRSDSKMSDIHTYACKYM
jgi:hypothetical protein